MCRYWEARKRNELWRRIEISWSMVGNTMSSWSQQRSCINDVEDIIVDIQMINTRNSEKENSPIQPAIILRRVRMVKKVKMKPHPQMNKYGLCCKKTKMKISVTILFHVLIVSLAETETSRRMFSTLSPLRGSVRINGERYS